MEQDDLEMTTENDEGLGQYDNSGLLCGMPIVTIEQQVRFRKQAIEIESQLMKARELLNEFIAAADEDNWCQECGLENINPVKEKAYMFLTT